MPLDRRTWGALVLVAPLALAVPGIGLVSDGLQLTWPDGPPTRFALSAVLAASGLCWLLGVTVTPRFRGALGLAGGLVAVCSLGVGAWILGDLVQAQLMRLGPGDDAFRLLAGALIARFLGHGTAALVPAAAAGRHPRVVGALGVVLAMLGTLQVVCLSSFLQDRWGVMWSADWVSTSVLVTLGAQGLALGGAMIAATSISPGGTDEPPRPPRSA